MEGIDSRSVSMTSLVKTVYGESTPSGQGGISIIRISGPNATLAAKILTNKPLPAPNTAVLRHFRHPHTQILIDQGFLLYLQAPHSFTAEDTIELQLHGSPSVVAIMLEALSCIPGLDPAQAGDFTRQAFTNGHLNFTEVEALADLIAAETEMQRRQAWNGLQGGHSRIVDDWNQKLISCLAQVEANLEFPEDDNLDTSQALEISRQKLCALLTEVETHLREARCGERLRQGIEIVIVGAPNVGKSSLFNALLGRERVLVSPIPGTTRDVIEARWDLTGYPVTITDMAGLRQSDDILEAEGIKKARERAIEADLRLILLSPELNQSAVQESLSWHKPGDIIALNKCDLEIPSPMPLYGVAYLTLSVYTGKGIEALTEALIQAAKELQGQEHGLITRTRHRDVFIRFHQEIKKALAEIDAPRHDMELVAEGLRQSGKALSHLCEPLDDEMILENLFSEFCIGK